MWTCGLHNDLCQDDPFHTYGHRAVWCWWCVQRRGLAIFCRTVCYSKFYLDHSATHVYHQVELNSDCQHGGPQKEGLIITCGFCYLHWDKQVQPCLQGFIDIQNGGSTALHAAIWDFTWKNLGTWFIQIHMKQTLRHSLSHWEFFPRINGFHSFNPLHPSSEHHLLNFSLSYHWYRAWQ